MKIRIITSCTGEKKFSPSNQLTQADFEHIHTQETFSKREAELEQFRTPAGDLYTGQQHIRLLKGIGEFKSKAGDESSIDLWIVSAGYGLVSADTELVPYECTFQSMSSSDIVRWADHLRIPTTIHELLCQPADLTIVILGDGYLRALALDEKTEFASPTLFLTSIVSQKRVKGKGKFWTVPLSNIDAKRFHCGLVGLKGEVVKRFLRWLALHTNNELLPSTDPAEHPIINWFFGDIPELISSLTDPCYGDPQGTTKQLISKAIPNPNVDKVVQIPEVWWQKPHRPLLRYFIPEWDDMVDPEYDFEKDIHSYGKGDWSNEVYAHQLYEEPNYDGILISKIVAEKSIAKKARINELGVHRYLRVPDSFQVMGDCGAFGYIMQETPPYQTNEILDYYTRLGFNMGVSIDHIIFAATEQEKLSRYQLTIHNAEEFLREHTSRHLSWTPVGAVQGWDAQSYAIAAKQYVEMGYQYIGIGGLVRTKTEEIIRILQAVHEVVPSTVGIHLFGLARLNALKTFSGLGASSVDSATPLRRAWLGTNDNYWGVDGEVYGAIRIPEAGKSFRAKQMLKTGQITPEAAHELERACFHAILAFDRGEQGINQVLDTLDRYDYLITPNRKSMREIYRKTLETKPWKQCNCEVCQKDGIHIIIFRGNNRNRRRGFHNVRVFYDMFQRVLAGERVKFKGKDLEILSIQQSLL